MLSKLKSLFTGEDLFATLLPPPTFGQPVISRVEDSTMVELLESTSSPSRVTLSGGGDDGNSLFSGGVPYTEGDAERDGYMYWVSPSPLHELCVISTKLT